VFNPLQAFLADGAKPDLIFTITLRHNLMQSKGMPRVKFILAAVDKHGAAKWSSTTKKVAAKKIKQAVNNETLLKRLTITFFARLISEHVGQGLAPIMQLLRRIDQDHFGGAYSVPTRVACTSKAQQKHMHDGYAICDPPAAET
jgi:hypothetical protein